MGDHVRGETPVGRLGNGLLARGIFNFLETVLSAYIAPRCCRLVLLLVREEYERMHFWGFPEKFLRYTSETDTNGMHEV